MTQFGALEALRARPIGDQSAARKGRADFRTRIPIRRDNEFFCDPVVEARNLGLKGANYYASAFNPPF